jgi:gamma-glutamyltranspeptidase/glutathione hydrolase
LDAPRWRWLTDKRVIVEPEFPPYLIEALRKRGHIVEISHDAEFFGRGQIIWKDPQTGMFIGGTDSRADGIVVAY